MHDDLGQTEIEDRRVVQRGGGARLALEALERLAITGEVVGEKFQGDEAPEPGVFGLVHHAHAAATEPPDNARVGDRPTPRGTRRCRFRFDAVVPKYSRSA